MKGVQSPEQFYDKEECGENEYKLYKDIHNVLEKHAEIWATHPRFVLMSAVEGLFEVYFSSILNMEKSLGMINKEISRNSGRPETTTGDNQ